MAIGLYMDVHIPQAITDQLRRRGVDVLTAIEDGMRRRDDPLVLERATELGRLVFTYDKRFKKLAERWQAQGRSFAGLLFARQKRATIGKLVNDLEVVAKASEPSDWANMVGYLPF